MLNTLKIGKSRDTSLSLTVRILYILFKNFTKKCEGAKSIFWHLMYIVWLG
jgi:hypothetical protein